MCPRATFELSTRVRMALPPASTSALALICGAARRTRPLWRDKVGMTFRPGKAVFVLVAADRWGPVLPSKIQARMYRAFAYEGDRLGKFCLDADYAWCLNYPMLKALSPSSLQWLQCRPYISVPVVARAFTMPLVTRHPRVVRP